MRRFLLPLLFACAAAPALAETIPVDSPRWQLQGNAHVTNFQGKHALMLSRGAALLADANFDTGAIEYDISIPNEDQNFRSVLFRGQDDSNYEDFYLRPHQNGHPDATQYMPQLNGLSTWQIYSGTNYEAQLTFPINQWFHIKLEVAEDSARVYINSDQPTLVIHDLKRARQAGYVALTGSPGTAYYANISITPGRPEAAPPEPPANLPAGLVQSWSVSPVMAEADALAAARANHLDALHWTALLVETNGIANLARAGVWSGATPSMLARLTLRTDQARSVAMRFGYSDKAQVYLNGVLLYAGDDSQYSRDYRFLGTIGMYDTLQFPLRRGDNEIVFAITEGGGGWAAQAAFSDRTGLTLVTAH